MRASKPWPSPSAEFFWSRPRWSIAVVLWFHPPGGEHGVYEGIRHDVGGWIFLHTTFLLFTPLMALAVFLLLHGLQSRAATVNGISLVFFLVFYTAYEVTVGLGTASSPTTRTTCRPGRDGGCRRRHPVLQRGQRPRNPLSVSLVAGLLGWMVAMVAATVALRRSGAAGR